MNYDEIQDKIYAFFDGELEAEERPEIESHIQTCQACASLLERWRQISTTVFKPLSPPDTEFFITRVMARLQEEDTLKLRRTWSWQVPFLALGVASLLFVLTNLIENGIPSTQNLLLNDKAASQNGFDTSNNELDELLTLNGEDL